MPKVQGEDSKPDLEPYLTDPDTWCIKEKEMSAKVEAILRQDKICKHSTRFSAEEKDGPLQSIYVKRPYFVKTKSHMIKVTIEEYNEDSTVS